MTINLNGIRAAKRKGFFDWLADHPADVICLQETRAHLNNDKSEPFCPQGYYCYFTDAEAKGYSGVGLFCRYQPDRITRELGIDWVDREGRYIQADYGNLTIASLYFPSGASGEHRQSFKFDFMNRFQTMLDQLRQKQNSYIICGDWNIAHTKHDIKNWRSNQKSSGFLPEERQWMDDLFNQLGYVDAFRVVNQQDGQYTWWSYRGQAWKNNTGWRIDYHIITSDLRDQVHDAVIYADTRFSDHAPLVIDYDLTLNSD